MFMPPWLSLRQRRWFSRPSLKARSATAHRRVRLSLEHLEDRLAPSADAVQVVVAPATLSTPFSTSQQNVTLTADVTDTTNPGTTVSEGTVTFTVKDSTGNVVGSAVPGNVTVANNKATATATFALPSDEPAGNYTIDVSYSDTANPANFTDGGDDTPGTLTVNPATVKVVGGTTAASFSTAAQSVTLTANLTDDSFPSDTIGEGTVTFTVKDSGGKQVGSPVQGTVKAGTTSGGTASATFTLPAGQVPGSYTVAVAFSDTANPADYSDDGTDTSGSLNVSAATTSTQASDATVHFSSSNQSVTLTANVSSSGGTVNEGSVLFTVVDSNGNTVGTATSGPVAAGSASVSYTVPGGTAAGNYTIEAAYTDGTSNNFAASVDNTHTLSVSTASSTSLSLTSVSITPNLTGGTAQLTLTAQVSNPNGTVNEGSLSFTVAGVSAQANVSNGSATVQLSVPIMNVLNGFTVSLSYTDNASAANFGNNSASDSVSTNILDALFPANLTFDSSGNESMQFNLGSLSLIGASYSSSTGLLSALTIGTLAVPVMYTNIGNAQVATVAGTAWGIIFNDNAGNFVGIADVQPSADGSLAFVVHDAHNNVIGEIPYGG
jgi:hypothetical protein